ncbi:MAG: tRNA guanosine(34) transglycosylase Tgt, partial [Planctomycetota bacterium]
MEFTVKYTDSASNARSGTLTLPRGEVQTPVFMPVGTLAAVKGLTPQDLVNLNADIILGNTYHLMLRPGEDVVADFGGIANFMAWHKPVLTDSGGYQVFSLAAQRKITEKGARFRSHIDGSEHFLTPERAVEIQHKLNSDIMMVLDECPPKEFSKDEVRTSLELTTRWAERCIKAKNRLEKTQKEADFSKRPFRSRFLKAEEQSLFPIVQGGIHLDLREESAKSLIDLGAPGYAIGGVSVGEGHELMAEVVEFTTPLLPDSKPRYLMGVGHPQDLLMGIASGIDMFDCVLPTRNGRNGGALTPDGPINLKNACHRDSKEPIVKDCDCYACQNFSKGYIRHLFIAGEMLASQLTSMHN